jgi:protein-S-isoprenylcysteine O-methyltransferase Ste14
MANAFFLIGVCVATILLGLLVLALLVPSLRLWPTPGEKTWQSYVFWPLFRSLNVLCFAVAISGYGNELGLPPWFRLAALAMLLSSISVFIYSFRVLGRDNSYCARDGLVTAGIYRWSRNPQNAMLMVVYAALAVAADSGPAILLCGAMMTVYVLMVLAEEPWLAATYGDDYRDYRRRVPRFFNWGLAASEMRRLLGGNEQVNRGP